MIGEHNEIEAKCRQRLKKLSEERNDVKVVENIDNPGGTMKNSRSDAWRLQNNLQKRTSRCCYETGRGKPFRDVGYEIALWRSRIMKSRFHFKIEPDSQR